ILGVAGRTMFNRSKTTTNFVSALLALLLVLSSPIGLAQEAKNQKRKGKGSQTAQTNAAKSLTEEQRVIHLLDRVSFGSRPGDVERVMKMGWEKYLDEQLHPERVSDQAAEQKLKNIESIHLSNSELAKNYPPPQVIREVLKQRGIELPGLNGVINPVPNPIQNPNAAQDDMTKKDAKKGFKELGKDAQKMEADDLGEPAMAPAQQPSAADDQAKRREAYQALREMGYRPQQQIVQELQQAKVIRAVYSEKQLQEVMTDFWFNHFNVFINKGADRVLTTSYERDVIRPRAFGKFEDLLKATAESPAMLFYLDNWMSASPNIKTPSRDELRQMRRQQRGFGRFGRMKPEVMLNQNGKIPQNRVRGLNENYAREIMELHTLGVDGGYTQKDVQEVARCFTGWTLRQPRNGAEFVFNPFMHDDGEKTVLGKKISSGGGMKDGYTVIHLLATHPATAKFISTKLARKFVSDNPPQSLLDRMAETFRKTDGDIRETLRAMFTSPEFFAAENYRAKIKTPFEMTVSAVRAIGADTNAGPQFHRWIAQMGEGLFLCQPPTGYADTAEHWVNTGALLERMNFALALSGNRIPGTRANLRNSAQGLNPLQTSQVVDHYVKLLLRGQVSPQTRATIDKSLGERQLAMAGGRVDIAKVVGLILGSPEFQRQ
ncbi:MAG: DUF1800 domain-containing protein, partial [Blastocatellia bacterium]